MKLPFLIALGSALALPLDALAKKPQQARAPLVRPAAAPDPDASGRLDFRDHKNQGRFSFHAKHLDTGLPFEAFVEDAVGAGTYTSVGALTVDGDSLVLEFDEKDGPLPLGVANVADLIGRLVEIRNAGQAHLVGLVPEFPPKNVNKGGAWDRGKIALTRPVIAPPDADAKGTLELRTKKADNRDRFTLKTQKVPAGTITFSLFLEDAVGSGIFVDSGPLTGDDDAAKMKVDTWSGAPLPFGVFDVEDLAGRALEVRGSDGFTYLETTVPAFHDGKKKIAKAKSNLAGTGGTGKVSTERHAVAPFERMKLEAKTTTLDGVVDLFVEDPASNVLTLVASLSTNGAGKCSFAVSTKSGAPLPFGATLEELDGMAIEVRVGGGATVLVGGSISAP